MWCVGMSRCCFSFGSLMEPSRSLMFPLTRLVVPGSAAFKFRVAGFAGKETGERRLQVQLGIRKCQTVHFFEPLELLLVLRRRRELLFL